MNKYKVGVYARKSHDDVKRGKRRGKSYHNPDVSLSISQQHDDGIRAAVEEYKVDTNSVRLFKDDGLSGKLPPTLWTKDGCKSRPGLSAVLEAIENNEINVLIVRKRDRLARDTLLFLQIIKFLDAHKTEFYCTDEKTRFGNDAAGRFTLTVLIATAELQLNQTQENIRNAKKYAKRHKRKMGPVFAIGYRDATEEEYANGSKGIEIDPTGAELVKKLFDDYLAGKTINQLVTFCNQNYPTATCRSGKQCYHSTIRRMLENVHYIGQMEIDGVAVPSDGLWPPLLDEKLFYQVQKKRQAERDGRNYPSTVKNHLLTGLLKCGYCKNDKGENCNMVVYSRFNKKSGKKVDTEYKCSKCHGEKSSFTMREGLWIEFVENMLGQFKTVTEGDPAKANAIRLQLDMLEAKRGMMHDRLRDDKITESEFDDYLDRCSAKKIELEKELKSVESAAQYIEPSKLQNWNTLSPDEKRIDLKRRFLKIEVFHKHIIVHGKKRSVTYPLMKRRLPNCHMPNAQNCLTPPDTKELVRKHGPLGDFYDQELNSHGTTADWTATDWTWPTHKLSKFFFYADPKLQEKYSREQKVKPDTKKKRVTATKKVFVRIKNAKTGEVKKIQLTPENIKKYALFTGTQN